MRLIPWRGYTGITLRTSRLGKMSGGWMLLLKGTCAGLGVAELEAAVWRSGGEKGTMGLWRCFRRRGGRGWMMGL